MIAHAISLIYNYLHVVTIILLFKYLEHMFPRYVFTIIFVKQFIINSRTITPTSKQNRTDPAFLLRDLL